MVNLRSFKKWCKSSLWIYKLYSQIDDLKDQLAHVVAERDIYKDKYESGVTIIQAAEQLMGKICQHLDVQHQMTVIADLRETVCGYEEVLQQLRDILVVPEGEDLVRRAIDIQRERIDKATKKRKPNAKS